MTNTEDSGDNNPYFGTVKDIPAEADLLGIKKYTDGLSNFIMNCETPMTIAIQGGWGTGKSSIMKQVQESLKEDSVEIVEFNTWQYSQFHMEDKLALSLISELIKELHGEPKLIEKLFTAAIIPIIKEVPAKAISKAISKTGVNGEVVVDNVIAAFTKQVSGIKEFKEEFQKLVDKKTYTKTTDGKKRNKRVVVFIDDLDRLSPVKAVELLEVLKLFLDCEGCVFVLAIDSEIVIKGIYDKYDELIQEDKGKSFFDKIIQVPFAVPTKQYDIRAFIKKSLEEDLKTFQNIPDPNLNDIVNIISNSLGNNPRGIKRLFNHYSLLLYIQETEDDSVSNWSNEEKIQLLSVLCLQLSFGRIYNKLLDLIESARLEDCLLEINNKKRDFELFDEPLKDSEQNYLEIFFRIFEKGGKIDLDSIESKLQLSTSTSMTVQERDFTKAEVFLRFWREFSKYISEQKEFEYEHPTGNDVKSRYYRVKNKTEKSLHCEFRVNKTSVGLVYGDTQNQSFNKKLLEKKKQIAEKFGSENDVHIREWNKNSYNHIPGVRIMNSNFGWENEAEWSEIFSWFITTLNSLSEVVKKDNLYQ